MIKKSIPILLLFSCLGWTGAAEKIGIINPDQVLQKTVKGKEVIARLEAVRSASQKKLEGLQREIDALEKELLSPALNDETREKKTLELQGKRTTLNRVAEDARNELAQKRQKEFVALQKEIFPVIEKIAKDEGFTLVFDVTTTGIAYASSALDITEKVIKEFDARNTAAAKTK